LGKLAQIYHRVVKFLMTLLPLPLQDSIGVLLSHLHNARRLANKEVFNPHKFSFAEDVLLEEELDRRSSRVTW
jgi:hypothetical protein